jgi:hypothetical protein
MATNQLNGESNEGQSELLALCNGSVCFPCGQRSPRLLFVAKYSRVVFMEFENKKKEVEMNLP